MNAARVRFLAIDAPAGDVPSSRRPTWRALAAWGMCALAHTDEQRPQRGLYLLGGFDEFNIGF
jgi:hypothetical protein